MDGNVTPNFNAVFSSAIMLASETGGVVYSEHILYGLVSKPLSVAGQILKDFISPEMLLNSFKLHPKTQYVELSVRANRIKERAIKMATLAGTKAATEHILYALLLETNSIAYEYLVMSGLNVNKLLENLENSFNKARSNIESQNKQAIFGELLEKLNGYSIDDNCAKSNIEQNDTDIKSFKSQFNELPVSQQSTENDLFNGVFKRESKLTGKISHELLKFGIDLTAKAKEGSLDPVVGRGKEIERIIQVLCRRTKNNPVLIGEPGVGKSAVIEGLAEAIVQKNVPDVLLDKIVFSLDMTAVVAGAKYRGEFEERFKTALDLIKTSGNIILFIDEIHTIIKTGGSEGALDAANILKPMLARGELQTVGATTIEEYRKYIEKDPALERRFQPIYVEEPTVSETIEILRGLKPKYEEHHKVEITDEALHAAAVMSDRYITDRFLPDKAIDLIDEASSKKKIYSFTVPDEIRHLNSRINELELEMSEASRREQFALAERLKGERDGLINQKQQQELEWNKKRTDVKLVIGEEEIAEIVASQTGVPVTKLTETEAEKMLNLGEHLKHRVIGQDDAVEALSKAIKRARAGLKDATRPIGSFVFLGPTGVGKTELTKALAAELFGDENLMIRIDMSEYMQKENVSKMIGSAPGYVGYDEGGQLTEKVRRKPYSVVLFDEIEKAHPDIYNLLLQILDDGRLTDSHGRVVSFKNTVIIMTSNAGAADISSQTKLGFNEENENGLYEKNKEIQINALKQFMRPEFINRIDDIIVFRKLTLENVEHIGDLMLSKLISRIAKQGITLEISDEAKQYVFKRGYDPEYGARPLRRVISKLIEDKLSEEILSGRFKLGDTVKIDLVDGKIEFCGGEDFNNCQ